VLGPVGLMASKGLGKLLTMSLATRGLREMKHTAEWLSRPYIVHGGGQQVLSQQSDNST
jgi:acetylglutamate kinase